jgi:predicted naringenin-chalcone synthase
VSSGRKACHGIAHQYSVLPVADLSSGETGKQGFYSPGVYPGAAQRMKVYENNAPGLAECAVEALDLQEQTGKITHLVVASCTGFMAPGLDHILARRLGLRADLQRTLVGFMGCSAAVAERRSCRGILP